MRTVHSDFFEIDRCLIRHFLDKIEITSYMTR